MDKNKAKKLAAAKKLLKDYQQKERASGAATPEKNDRAVDVNLINSSEHITVAVVAKVASVENISQPVNTDYVTNNESAFSDNEPSIILTVDAEDDKNKNTIEILVKEKTLLTAELAKCQSECKKFEFDIEEVNSRLHEAHNRIADVERNFKETQVNLSSLANEYNKTKTELDKTESNLRIYQSQLNEKNECLEEIRRELKVQISRNDEISQLLKEKDCELKLRQIRVDELSEEGSIAADNRVESLTQVKFQNEQQIRDLQTKIYLLETERDQSNQQYQKYVEFLKKDIKILTDKNNQFMADNESLSKRENSFISHIGDLEKQIQQNIAKQEHILEKSEEAKKSMLDEDNTAMYENVAKEKRDLEENMKIIQGKYSYLEEANSEKERKILELEKTIENIMSERPNDAKLLAEIQQDKATAAIAVSQNEELKKQLNEIQLKLIELTNDKVDLVNKLDSETYANRAIRSNYLNMEEQLREVNQRLQLKDEEMIRLINENNELNNRLSTKTGSSCEHGSSYHKEKDLTETHDHSDFETKCVSNLHEDNDSHGPSCGHENNEHLTEENQSENHEISCSHTDHDHDICSDSNTHSINLSNCYNENQKIATPEAMAKLQKRFKTLINDVADLTDEKQRLEHLVLQLQGETETIGEYVALYQTQRRLLKQREIEKDNQLSRFLLEREDMKTKIKNLEKLINFVFKTKHIAVENQNNLIAEHNNNKAVNGDHDDKKSIIEREEEKSDESVKKIYTLINEIKDKDSSYDVECIPSVDHCSCCSGNFETI